MTRNYQAKHTLGVSQYTHSTAHDTTYLRLPPDPKYGTMECADIDKGFTDYRQETDSYLPPFLSRPAIQPSRLERWLNSALGKAWVKAWGKKR